MSRLRHPNIIKFKEIITDKKNDYCHIIMEYADGGDLNEKIKSQKSYFQEEQILNWFCQICLGLKYIHEHKIIHRDLKTQNIFLTKKNEIKLGDFGISKNLKKTLDKAYTIIGTPYYFSPELINNEPYDYKTDIWSLGILLYELCCLKLPFQGNNIAQLSMKILKGVYQPLPNIYSNDIKVLVKKMLNVNKNKRPSIYDIINYRIIKEKIEIKGKKINMSERKFTKMNSASIIMINSIITQNDNKEKEIKNNANYVFDEIYSNFKIEEKQIETDINKKNNNKINNKETEISQNNIYISKKNINYKKKGRNLSVEVPSKKLIQKKNNIIENKLTNQNKEKTKYIYLKKHPLDKVNISNQFESKNNKIIKEKISNISKEEKIKTENEEIKKERKEETIKNKYKKEIKKNKLLEEFMKNKQEKIKKSEIISESINDGLWIRNFSIFSSSKMKEDKEIDFSKKEKNNIVKNRYKELEEEEDEKIIVKEKNKNNNYNFLTHFDILETFNYESENNNEEINLHKPNQSGTIFNLFDSIQKEKNNNNIFQIDLDFLENKCVNSDNKINVKKSNNQNEKEEKNELINSNNNNNLSLDFSLFDINDNKIENENKNKNEINEENIVNVLKKRIINNIGDNLYNDFYNFLKSRITTEITDYNYEKIISDFKNKYSIKYSLEQLEKAIKYYFDIAFLIIKK